MKNPLYGLFRLLKKIFLDNLGLKALALFISCYVFFSFRPDGASDAESSERTARPLLPVPAAAAPVQIVYVTNTVTVVSNIVERVPAPAETAISADDSAPAETAPAAGSAAEEGTGKNGE